MPKPIRVKMSPQRAQIWALLLISGVIIFAAPRVWDYSPDAGIYLGTALSMLEGRGYWFNGQPNLLYYPGTSTLIAIAVSAFSLEFHTLHIFFGLLGVSTLWLSRVYFSIEQYGRIGLLLPILLGVNALFQAYAHSLLSDIAFLAIVLLSLILWRRFYESGGLRWYLACAVAVALAPMFRFQGLFLLAAFWVALLVYLIRHPRNGWRFALPCMSIAVLTLAPFVLWTLRNYILHTPDTYNMANRYFFGLPGIRINGPGFGEVDWIDADWKYPVYQLMYLFGRGLGGSTLGYLRTYVPLEFTTAAVMGLILIGGRTWLRRANILEAVFVITNLAFLLITFIGGRSLYIVDRYWLPLLPFFILIAGFGVLEIGRRVEDLVAKWVLIVFTGALIGLLIASGSLGWAVKLSDTHTEQMEQRYDTIVELGAYIRENTAEDAIILGNDWGVTPLLTDRKSYQVVRSACDKPTLEIIRGKVPSHLVVLPAILTTEQALTMAETYPQVFTLLFTTGDRGNGSFGAVYSINHASIPQLISGLQCR